MCYVNGVIGGIGGFSERRSLWSGDTPSYMNSSSHCTSSAGNHPLSTHNTVPTDLLNSHHADFMHLLFDGPHNVDDEVKKKKTFIILFEIHLFFYWYQHL